jgi:hypothetical protein
MKWGNVVSAIAAENIHNRILKGSEKDRKVMHMR